MLTTGMPDTGRKKEDILDELKTLSSADPEYKTGRLWSLVYYLGEEHTDFLKDAYNSYFSANGLNPTAFKGLKQLENDVIRTTASLLHGDKNVCGVVTSGGTESCLLAVKTYRDLGRAKKNIRRPEMILPETAHVAWAKGAEYFGVKALYAPLDRDYRVDVKAVRKLVSRNTVMILGSAPEYPHGLIDPIEELGEIAVSKNIPLHVDACVGGYILPFIEMLDVDLPLWDYRVKGVTSISADTHKYGFAAKGASTITYRSLEILKHQMFVLQNWPGGVFASPALLGTRPGGAYAAAWAAIQAIGRDGYIDLTEKTLRTTNRLKVGISEIPDLKIVGNPQASLFAYTSTSSDVNIFAVGDFLEKKNWHIDRLQRPDALHAMVTPGHEVVVDQYLEDLREAVSWVRQHPEAAETGGAATYGMIAHLPFQKMVKKQVLDMFADMYGPEGKMIDMESSMSSNDSGGTEKTASGMPPFIDGIIKWYIKRKQRTGN
ncbi:MAG: aspartate aminotransferase family protein [Spirochaetales bacterium]|nr:aspartate aminotransferase family protein [Spirochaetales bacterium]